MTSWPPGPRSGRRAALRKLAARPLPYRASFRVVRMCARWPHHRRGDLPRCGGQGREERKSIIGKARYFFADLTAIWGQATAAPTAWIGEGPGGLRSAVAALHRVRRDRQGETLAPYGYICYVTASKAQLYITGCSRMVRPALPLAVGTAWLASQLAAPRRLGGRGPIAAQTPARPAWAGASFPPQPRRPIYTAEEAVQSGRRGAGVLSKALWALFAPSRRRSGGLEDKRGRAQPRFARWRARSFPRAPLRRGAVAPARALTAHHAFLNACSICEECYSFV